jgi:putative Mg2+ transporter-C (MgtC) family protein
VGAAVFVDMANRLDGHAGAVHVAAYVVSGIGFLGAGAIMREEGNVRGLNTAATLWGSAAVGAAAGADLIAEAFLASLFVLAANTMLRPVVNAINRKPMDHDLVEATNSIHLVASRGRQKWVLEQLEEELERSSHPVRDLSIKRFGDDEIAIEVILAATSVDEAELDLLVARLTALDGVSQAYWNASAGE